MFVCSEILLQLAGIISLHITDRLFYVIFCFFVRRRAENLIFTFSSLRQVFWFPEI